MNSGADAQEAGKGEVAEAWEEPQQGVEEVKRLKKALQEQTERAEGYLSQLKYLQADLDNFQKAVRKRAEEEGRMNRERLILRIVDVRDDLERAVEAAGASEGKTALLEGVQMVLTNIDELLKGEGVIPIEAVGKTLDPTLHEAVAFSQRNDCEENTVTKEVRKGYTLHGRVIRVSMVEVARRGAEDG